MFFHRHKPHRYPHRPVLPIVRKPPDLLDMARDIHQQLKREFMSFYDESGTIGRRYRRQDEIGTPYCVTIDFDSLGDQAATVRHQDAMTQERVAISEVADYLAVRLKGA